MTEPIRFTLNERNFYELVSGRVVLCPNNIEITLPNLTHGEMISSIESSQKTRKIISAQRRADNLPSGDKITYFGVPLIHFDKDQLRRIASDLFDQVRTP